MVTGYRSSAVQGHSLAVTGSLCLSQTVTPLIMTPIVVTTLVSVSSWFLAIDMMESASKTIVGDSGNMLPRRQRRRREGGVGGEGRVCTFVPLAIGVMTTLRNALQKHGVCVQVVYLGCNSWNIVCCQEARLEKRQCCNLLHNYCCMVQKWPVAMSCTYGVMII